jgi:hypothetical protein
VETRRTKGRGLAARLHSNLAALSPLPNLV